MSMNSRYRERKYNTSDNDRLLRALSQPVQAWDKKWTQHSNSKTLQTFKWVKSERIIEYEQDEESEEEPELMETEQPTETLENEATGNKEPITETMTKNETNQDTTKNIDSVQDMPNSNKSEQSIPGGPSSLITNKAISSVQQDDMDDDDSRSQTPKLNDISDEEIDQSLDNDDDDTVDNMNDASKHPALAPHAQVHMTDDETMTDSTAATPQTEGNTPMPQLEDDTMEEPPQTAHPLSQEILTGIIANEEIASLNNDSPAIQTPEDVVSNSSQNHIHHEHQ